MLDRGKKYRIERERERGRRIISVFTKMRRRLLIDIGLLIKSELDAVVR